MTDDLSEIHHLERQAMALWREAAELRSRLRIPPHLSGTQASTLDALKSMEPVRISHLARALGISVEATAGRLKVLASKGQAHKKANHWVSSNPDAK